jgi:D-glycero-beta-D-manno-heptose-7-phosphate kinase
MTTKLQEVFKQFGNTRALVIGDVMLDTYWWGESNRISPEAPVPIVDIYKTEHRLGGAANVAVNLQSLGTEVFLLSITGNDENGKQLQQLLQQQQLDPQNISFSIERKTTQKNRVMNGRQQAFRYDVESKHELTEQESEKIKSLFDNIISENSIDVIILQDYNKGLFTKKMIAYIIAKAGEKNIPVAVDPKKEHFFEYKHAALFKPNMKELREALETDIDKNRLDTLFTACKKLNSQLACDKILLTLSDKGIFGYSESEHFLFPAYDRNIADVSGAGDTVIAVAALCISQQLDFELTARLSNIAGGLVCETVGVASIDKEKFMQQADMLLS